MTKLTAAQSKLPKEISDGSYSKKPARTARRVAGRKLIDSDDKNRINGFNVEFLGAQRPRLGEDY